MTRFKVVSVTDDVCGTFGSVAKDYYIMDITTKRNIVECANHEIAEMVCLALNYTQNEGLLTK